jgi:hypothetical protein
MVELWPCGYTAKCSAPECCGRASTILRYLDNQDRPDRQTEACEIHASDLSAELTVIEPKALVLIAPLDDFSLTK